MDGGFVDGNFSWKDRLVLVTGAAGFIGSHLTERLISEGARVRAFIRYTSRADSGMLRELVPDYRQRLELIGGDLRDADAVRQAVAGVEVVFHLGALISIPYSYIHPEEVVDTNILGTLNVLQACRQHHPLRMIHTSSSEVYGSALETPIRESHPLQGQSPYSASKIGADKLVESFYNSYDLPVVTVRPFNTYGPRQSARAVIPTIITQALTRTVIRLGNMDTKRDFTYVSDTVDGFMKAAGAQNASGRVFNLGTGKEVSIGELAHTIIQIVDRPVALETDPHRLRPARSEVTRLLSDNREARQALGWEPTIPLEMGLSKTVEWIREHISLFRVGEYEY